ncbi:AAA domain containing protein [uncultured Caudovirales phage]|uniref:AAA domain containing protein n=1 Tax=uncultured Caudovirales phage TaxID=2100421 RepID=A0A6J5L3Q2_9CAUD|nr:AAA domain containing protein [uncultured Caudovirales phage]
MANFNWKKYKRKIKINKATGKRLDSRFTFFEEDWAGFAMRKEKDIIMGVSSVDEFISGTILQRRFDGGNATNHKKLKILANKKEWNEFLHSKLSGALRVIQTKDYSGWAIDDDLDCYIDYYISGNTTNINLIGDSDFISFYKRIIETRFEHVESYIKWIYDGDGNNINLPLNQDMLPIDSMYPFLNGESLNSYYDRFMKSTASVLLLIGPPGTGKTTFIRGLLDRAKTSATVTYDPAILSKDGIFAEFLEDEECSIMVLEDSDSFLSSRNEGNDLMHKFLNVGDGLVTVKGKKMVFSTNLPSIRDVDPALLRPGRCFDVAKFGSLTKEQAIKFAADMNITITTEKNAYTVAEVFHEMNVRTVNNFGFNQ